MSTRRSSNPNKTLRSTYLYADGHAVQIFEKTDPDAGKIEFAEVIETFTNASVKFKGRIVIGPYSGGLLALIAKATFIQADEPTVSGNGVEVNQNIPVGRLQVHNKDGALNFYDLPGFMSGEYKYQPDAVAEPFDPNVTKWGDARVARIHRAKGEAATA